MHKSNIVKHALETKAASLLLPNSYGLNIGFYRLMRHYSHSGKILMSEIKTSDIGNQVNQHYQHYLIQK